MRMKIVLCGAVGMLFAAILSGCTPQSVETAVTTPASGQTMDVATVASKSPDVPDLVAPTPLDAPESSPTVQEAQEKDEEDRLIWITAIVEGVYGSEVGSIVKRNDPAWLKDENVTAYEVACGNDINCLIAIDSSGRAYLSESMDVPNFRSVIIGETQTWIGDSITEVPTEEQLAARADEVLQELQDALDLGTDLELTHREREVVDHREVEIFVVKEAGRNGKEVGLLAIDAGLETAYYAETNDADYHVVVRADGKATIGDAVTVGSIAEAPAVNDDDTSDNDEN